MGIIARLKGTGGRLRMEEVVEFRRRERSRPMSSGVEGLCLASGGGADEAEESGVVGSGAAGLESGGPAERSGCGSGPGAGCSAGWGSELEVEVDDVTTGSVIGFRLSGGKGKVWCFSFSCSMKVPGQRMFTKPSSFTSRYVKVTGGVVASFSWPLSVSLSDFL